LFETAVSAFEAAETAIVVKLLVVSGMTFVMDNELYLGFLRLGKETSRMPKMVFALILVGYGKTTDLAASHPRLMWVVFSRSSLLKDDGSDVFRQQL
jgi:hypothetical protein